MNKSHFPIFSNFPDLIYLDNAATTHKPQVMLDALQEYYSHKNSNIGRGVYELANLSEQAHEQSRKIIATFFGAQAQEVIFTQGATAGLNQVAYMLSSEVKAGQKIILSIFEHHANILPWQRLAKEKGLEIVFLSDSNSLAYPESLPDSFWNNVAIVALTHVSNVTGQTLPIEKWTQQAHRYGAKIVIDGAQGVSSYEINFHSLNVDYYVFSAHKLYSPMGVGVILCKFAEQNHPPLLLGGGIIEDVSTEDYILISGNHFEAGTPNVADVYAFAKTLEYLTPVWREQLANMKQLERYLVDKLKDEDGVFLINPEARKIFAHTHIVAFNIQGVHAHDVGTFLDNQHIAVRVGKHCTHPLHTHFHLSSSVRASLGIYNTQEDVDKLFKAVIECRNFFRSV